MNPEDVRHNLETLIQDISHLSQIDGELRPHHITRFLHEIVTWFIELIAEVDR